MTYEHLDPADDDNYTWGYSDVHFLTIVNAGMGVYLRLGGSSRDKTDFLPKDPDDPKWSTRWENFKAASLHIAEHYVDLVRTSDNDEQYRGPIVGVEIWNEPNNCNFWDLGQDLFVEYYVELLEELTAAYPGLPVGGPGFGWGVFPDGIPHVSECDDNPYWVKTFIDKVISFNTVSAELYRKPNFLSFHVYSADPAKFCTAAITYQNLAQYFWTELTNTYPKLGLQGMECHVSEWNTTASTKPDPNRGTGVGAAQLTGAWICMAAEGIDKAIFHRGLDETDKNGEMGGFGLLTYDGPDDGVTEAPHLKPIGEAFKLWQSFNSSDGPQFIITSSKPKDNFWYIARQSSTESAVILLSNTSNNTIPYRIRMSDSSRAVSASSMQIEQIDKDGNYSSFTPDNITIELPESTVHLVHVNS